MCSEGAALHYDEVVADISVLVSLHHLFYTGSCTHEKMTFLGRRFLEKGRRSGSCFDVQSSMMRYRTQPVAKLVIRRLSWRQLSSFALVLYCLCYAKGADVNVFGGPQRRHQACDPPGEMPRAERRSEGECRVSRNIKDSGFVRRRLCIPGVSNAVGEGCLEVVLGRLCSAAVLSLWL